MSSQENTILSHQQREIRLTNIRSATGSQARVKPEYAELEDEVPSSKEKVVMSMPEKEYVPTRALAQEISEWVSGGRDSYRGLAAKAGVSPRAITKIMNEEKPYQTVFLADRIMNAMGRYIYHMKTVWRDPRNA